MERAVVLIGALAALPVFSGCGSDAAQTPTTDVAAAQPKSPRQLLLAVPKLGELTGSCKPVSTFRLTYTGDRDFDEYVVVRIGGKVALRRRLDPRQSVSFSAKVHHRGRVRPLDESARIVITTTTSHSPFDARSVARFKLADAQDGTGDECLLESAVVRASAHLH